MSAQKKFLWLDQEFDTKEDCERAIESEVAKFLCDGDAGSVLVEPSLEPDVRCLRIRVEILPR